MRRVLIAVPTVGARNFWRQQRIDSLWQAARESDAERKRGSKREREIEREKHIKREIERDEKRGRQWEGTHHRVCLVCKVFVGDPCAQQFQIDAKKKSNENR